jgi:electron transport complex protein RnfB
MNIYNTLLAATNSILISSLIGAGIALALGAIILVVFKIFAVPVDERAKNLNELLPGVNCGGCGYSGCMGYAEALVEGTETETTLCTAGGAETADDVAEFLGVAPGIYIPTVAHVYCQGSDFHTETRYDYTGPDNCAAATGLFAGPNSCTYGCLSMGDCVDACKFNAIYIEEGVARVNHENCVACGKCVEACPKYLLHMIPKHEAATVVSCSNHWPGAKIRKECSIGCIGCTRCVKVCPVEAISMDDNLAIIDQNICIHCGDCVEICPTASITQGLIAAPGTHQDSPKAKPMVKKEQKSAS